MEEGKKPGGIARVLRQAGGWHLLGIALVANLGEGASKALAALFGGMILDAILAADRGLMVNNLLLVALMALTMAMCIIIKDTLLGKYLEDGIARLRRRTVEALNRVGLRWLEERHTGELSARVSADLNALASSLRPVLIMGITSSLARLIPIVLLFYTDWLLTLCIFAMVPITIGAQWIASRPIKRYRAANQAAIGKLSSTIYDSFGSYETVKSLSLEGEMRGRFEAAQGEQLDAALKENRVMALLSPLSGVSWLIPQIVLVLVGGAFVLNGRLTYGQLVMFISLASSAIGVLGDIGGLFGSIRQLSANAARIVDLWDVEPERAGGLADLPRDAAEAVVFEGVRFRYERQEDAPVTLADASFTVPRGGFVALVGESGCGKSTALKIAASLYPPEEGSVRLFGRDIGQWDLDAYRSHIAYVTQETFLFPGSVRENITAGSDAVDEGWLWQCVKLAQLEETVALLPEGLDTLVGERGDALSGGQRQRLSIARALYKRAELLFLDEATSALDRSNEAAVLEGILGMEKRPTLLMVTHHLGNVAGADAIMVFKEGRIVESGAHARLMELGGEYARLVARGEEEIQF